MKKLRYLTIWSFLLLSLNSMSQKMTNSAPGVVDAAFISERFFAFETIVDIGGPLWWDVRRKYIADSLKLTPLQDSILAQKGQGGIYPSYISIPYLPLFYEDDHWSTRVYKTIDLKTSHHGVFWDKGPARHKYIRESDKSISTDTVYYENEDWIFKKVIKRFMKKGWTTVYANEKYDHRIGPDYKRDTAWADSLADLMPTINKIVLKEDYWYDKYTGRTGSNIIAVGFYADDKSIFWLYFPEMSYAIRSPFSLFDYDLQDQYMTTFDEILKDHKYDIESIRYKSHHINQLYWGRNEANIQDVNVMTEMNALFWVDLMKSYVEADFKNYTGEVSLPIHDHLTMKTTLESGQIQGDCDFVDQNGNIVVHATFKNHSPHGSYFEKWENGKLKERGEFKNGLKEGEWANFYDNKKKMGLRFYERGWMKGEQQIWHSNGKKYMTFTYDNFMLNGPYSRFDEKGSLMEKGEFTDNYPNKNWTINLTIPDYISEVVLANPKLDWMFPVNAFNDNVLSYELILEQGDKPTGCPSPIWTCVTLVEMSEVK